MASIEKRGNSYRIVVSCGLDSAGKQIKKSMTWTPSPGMTAKQTEKELKRQEALFEEKCRTGQVLDQQIRFSEFVEVWWERYAKQQLKEKTLAGYKGLLERILPAIGHIRLDRLQPQHLLEFYENLAEEGVKQGEKYHCNIDLKALLRERKQTKVALAQVAGVGVTVLNSITQGKNVSQESADRISSALQIPMEKLFAVINHRTKLSEKTILHHHRLISAILQVAVQWQVIPSNPCMRVKAPRVQRKEARYLEE